MNNLSKENVISNDDGFQRFCDISLDDLTDLCPKHSFYTP